jgi:hypothetical protein
MRKIYLTILLILFVSCAYADTIFLKSGKTVSGTIVEETDRYWRIDVADGLSLRYYTDEIARIERTASPRQKIFTIAPNPLIMSGQPQPEPEEAVSAKDAVSTEIESAKKQVQPTEAQQLAGYSKESSPEDKKGIEDASNTYLSLVCQGLLEDTVALNDQLRKLSTVVDVASTNEYKLFRNILEQARSNKAQSAKADWKEEDIKNEFLKSHIIGFQRKYLADSSVVNSDFQIVKVAVSDDQTQAVALIKAKGKSLQLKLHKINQTWLIYSF